MPPTQTDRELAERIEKLGDNLAAFQGQVFTQFGEIHAQLGEIRGTLKTLIVVIGLAATILVACLGGIAATLYQQGVTLGRLAQAIESREPRVAGPRAEAPASIPKAGLPTEPVFAGEPIPER